MTNNRKEWFPGRVLLLMCPFDPVVLVQVQVVVGAQYTYTQDIVRTTMYTIELGQRRYVEKRRVGGKLQS